jgi:hypothetical protein
MSEEYWIISVPGKGTSRQTFDEVCQATARDQLSVNYMFNIPDLKVILMNKSFSFHYLFIVFFYIIGWYTRFTYCTFG